MNDIKLPPMPEGYGYDEEDMEAYAREAVRLNATVPGKKDCEWTNCLHRVDDKECVGCPLASAPAAPQPAQPLKVTDAMAYSFHSAISDGSIGVDEAEDIKRGLAAALANYEAPQPAQDKSCAQCKAPYKQGATCVGCPKCAPGLRVSEAEFRKPIGSGEVEALRKRVLFLEGQNHARGEALEEWLDKTAWITRPPHEEVSDLGKHRADILKERIDRLTKGGAK